MLESLGFFKGERRKKTKLLWCVFFLQKKRGNCKEYHSWRGHLVMVPTLKSPQKKGAVVSTSQHDDHDVAGCEQQGTKVPRYQGTKVLAHCQVSIVSNMSCNRSGKIYKNGQYMKWGYGVGPANAVIQWKKQGLLFPGESFWQFTTWISYGRPLSLRRQILKFT